MIDIANETILVFLSNRRIHPIGEHGDLVTAKGHRMHHVAVTKLPIGTNMAQTCVADVEGEGK